MKRESFMKSMLLGLAMTLGSLSVYAQEAMTIRFVDETGAPIRKASATLSEKIRLGGTNESAIVTVVATGLTEDIQVSATNGFSVTPESIKAGTEKMEITVTNLSSKNYNTGKLILRSGDIRTYVNIISYGTPLPQKDLSQNPIYKGAADDDNHSFDASKLSENGYTVEVRAKTENPAMQILPYAVTKGGLGFMGYVKDTSMGMLNSRDVFVSEKGISNPANGGTFYNTDGQYHTYRYAVTADRRVFVYRDGMPVDT
ncbi:MAG: sugar-binding protein, partial [Bacteroidaceae bacterium]|nr:sugar-binding protein [Bacteroidaceae bacterium]